VNFEMQNLMIHLKPPHILAKLMVGQLKQGHLKQQFQLV